MSQFSDTPSPFGGKVSAWAVGRNSEFPGRKLELFDRDKLSTFSPVAAFKRLFWLCPGWIWLQNGAVCRWFSRMKRSFFWGLSKGCSDAYLKIRACHCSCLYQEVVRFIFHCYLSFIWRCLDKSAVKGPPNECHSRRNNYWLIYELSVACLFVSYSLFFPVIYWTKGRSKASDCLS